VFESKADKKATTEETVLATLHFDIPEEIVSVTSVPMETPILTTDKFYTEKLLIADTIHVGNGPGGTILTSYIGSRTTNSPLTLKTPKGFNAIVIKNDDIYFRNMMDGTSANPVSFKRI
jgi:hypothetical protein